MNELALSLGLAPHAVVLSVGGGSLESLVVGSDGRYTSLAERGLM